MKKERMMFTDSSSGVNIAKDPAVVWFRGKYRMYYSVTPDRKHPEAGWGIGIAQSDDRINWEILGKIRPEGELEAKGICAPGAMVYEGKIHIFYQTYGDFAKDAICHAWSEDGIHFTRNATNPIVRAEGDWNNGRAIDADVIQFQRMLYLYFASRDPEGKIQFQVVSRCPMDGKFERDSWEQCCDQPVLRPEKPWEKECIEAAAALVHEDRVYLFYAGAYNNSPQQIGVAVSSDGIHFERISEEPFLPCGLPGTWNSSESGHPYVFEDRDGKVYLFYQGNNDNGRSWYLSCVQIEFRNGIPVLVDEKI